MTAEFMHGDEHGGSFPHDGVAEAPLEIISFGQHVDALKLHGIQTYAELQQTIEELRERDPVAVAIIDFYRRLFWQEAARRSEIEHVASIDHLTGLSNRRVGMGAVARIESSATESAKKHLIFMDLNNMGILNKIEGEQAGDASIRRVAEVLRETTHLCNTRYADQMRAQGLPLINEKDLIRWSGDEFVAIVPNVAVAYEGHVDDVAVVGTTLAQMFTMIAQEKYGVIKASGPGQFVGGQNVVAAVTLSGGSASFVYAPDKTRRPGREEGGYASPTIEAADAATRGAKYIDKEWAVSILLGSMSVPADTFVFIDKDRIHPATTASLPETPARHDEPPFPRPHLL